MAAVFSPTTAENILKQFLTTKLLLFSKPMKAIYFVVHSENH